MNRESRSSNNDINKNAIASTEANLEYDISDESSLDPNDPSFFPSCSRTFSDSSVARTTSTRSASSTESQCMHSLLHSSLQSDGSSKSVKFGNISIREFDVTVGDNPACSSGVPISLSWNYNPVHEEFPVEVFENYRDGQRCTPDELKLSERVRYQMLVDEWKVSKSKIARAERQCRQTKNERQESLESLQFDEIRDGDEDIDFFKVENTANKTKSFGRNLKARLVKMLKR